MQSETQIQSEILRWLEENKYVHWRNYVGPVIRHGRKMPSPMAGLPDIIGILKTQTGRMFAIEIKAKGGKISDKQIDWIRRLEDAGVVVIVTRNVDQVIDVLTKSEGV